METRRTFLKTLASVFIVTAGGQKPIPQATTKQILDASTGSLLNCRQAAATNDASFAALKDSICQRGLINEIAISTTGQVLYGFRRLAAIKELLTEGRYQSAGIPAYEYDEAEWKRLGYSYCPHSIEIDVTRVDIKT